MRINSIVFAFDDDALLVANTGTKFTRKGVVSICNMDLSAKTVNSDREPDDEVYKVQDKELVGEILEDCMRKYDDHKNTFTEDVNDEEKVIRSYTGRFVWELLQNADDAMGENLLKANLIGTKGIGFKSVLEITDEPEIYSGDFRFHFSREKSRGVLERKISKWQWNERMGIPVCRLPHPKKPGLTVQELLDKGYVTVLRLPLNEEKRHIVEDELSGFCSRSLLFCQNIKSVCMRIGDAPRDIKVQRGDRGQIKLVEDGHSTHWQVWDDKKNVEGEKRLSVRMCLPIDDKKIGCLKEKPRLYVFFPTKEQVPDVYALIHVSCEVEDNRQHLAGYQPHQDKICEMLEGMTRRILSKIPPDVALCAFGHAQVAEDAGDGMVMQLKNAIAAMIQETAFIPLIGGGMAKPGDVRLWEHGLGNAVDPCKARDQNLCHPDINNDKESAEILSRLGAKRTSNPELARLLRFCRNRDGEDCLMAWNVAQTLMGEVKPEEKAECAEELRKAPFWLSVNEEAKARSIDGEIPLVATKPKDLPHWLSVDVIDKRFRELVQDEIKRHKEEDERWENALSGSLQPPENKRGYFDQILLPYCEKLAPEEWQKKGWEVLEMAFKWGEKDGNDEPLVIDFGNAEEKQKRAEIFHLPAGGNTRKWRPALQCYAGEAWGGPGIFDKYFAKVECRHVLLPSDDWKIDIQDTDKSLWKNLMSWLGCSWMLKIKKEKSLPPGRDDVEHTQGRPFSDFCFEHFDKMFAASQNGRASDYAPLLNMVPEMYKIAHEKKAHYFCYKDQSVKSYALKQLEENEWVPCEQSLLFPDKRLFKPRDVYLPDSTGELLPELDKRNLGISAQDAIEDTLKKLGTKDSISQNPEQLICYMNQLNRLPGRNEADIKWGKDDKDRGRIARAAKEIFSAYAKIDSRNLPNSVMVPCLRDTEEGEIIHFEKADNTYWADKPYFNEPQVRKKILETEKLNVFFLFLIDGKSFGLKRLSEFLQLEPKCVNENPEATEKLRKRYEERRAGMAKATEQELPKQLEIVAYENIALQAATHAEITVPTIKFWRQSEHKVDINAGAKANMWRGLAAALGELTNGSQHKAHFQLLLEAETWNSFLSLLREDYDLTEESIKEVKGLAPFLITPYPPRIPEVEVVPDPVRPPRGPSVIPVNSDKPPREVPDGKRGEEALLEWLKGKFGPDNVTNMNERHPNHPRYDILVKKNGEEHYYECKSSASPTPPRQISMTEAQFTKAKHAQNRYWLCVIYDLNNNPVKMLDPICNPAKLKSEPITTEYKINLPSRESDIN